MYVAAQYQNPDPIAPADAPKPVVATDEAGQKYYLNEDSQEGMWLEYLATGGTIDPAVPDVNSQITQAPDHLFGGPTTGEVYGKQ